MQTEILKSCINSSCLVKKSMIFSYLQWIGLYSENNTKEYLSKKMKDFRLNILCYGKMGHIYFSHVHLCQADQYITQTMPWFWLIRQDNTCSVTLQRRLIARVPEVYTSPNIAPISRQDMYLWPALNWVDICLRRHIGSRTLNAIRIVDISANSKRQGLNWIKGNEFGNTYL